MVEREDQPGDHRGRWLRDIPPLMQGVAVLITAAIVVLTYLGTRADTRADTPAVGEIEQPSDGYESSERDVAIAGTAAPQADRLWLIVETNDGTWYPQERVRPGADGHWRVNVAIGPLKPSSGDGPLEHTVLLVEATPEAARTLDAGRGTAQGMPALVDGVHELDSIEVTRTQP